MSLYRAHKTRNINPFMNTSTDPIIRRELAPSHTNSVLFAGQWFIECGQQPIAAKILDVAHVASITTKTRGSDRAREKTAPGVQQCARLDPDPAASHSRSEGPPAARPVGHGRQVEPLHIILIFSIFSHFFSFQWRGHRELLPAVAKGVARPPGAHRHLQHRGDEHIGRRGRRGGPAPGAAADAVQALRLLSVLILRDHVMDCMPIRFRRYFSLPHRHNSFNQFFMTGTL